MSVNILIQVKIIQVRNSARVKLFAGRGFYRASGDISRLIPAAEKKFAVEFVKLRTTELGDETHEIFAREHRRDGRSEFLTFAERFFGKTKNVFYLFNVLCPYSSQSAAYFAAKSRGFTDESPSITALYSDF